MWIDGPTFRAVTIGTGPTNPIPQKSQGTSPRDRRVAWAAQPLRTNICTEKNYGGMGG